MRQPLFNSGVGTWYHGTLKGAWQCRNMTNLDRSVAVMLENTVEGLEQANAPLRHVYFTLGLKHYGQPHSNSHARECDHSQQQCSLNQQRACMHLWQPDTLRRQQAGHACEVPLICRRPLGCHQGAVR